MTPHHGALLWFYLSSGVVDLAPSPRMLFLMVLPLLVGAALLLLHPRGRRRLLDLRLRALPLLWVAVAVKLLQTSEASWAGAFLEPRDGLLPTLTIWACGIAFTLLNLGAAAPMARAALATFAMGFTLNTLTTVVNGAMPFSVSAARAAGFPEETINAPVPGYEPITDGTALALFADVIPLPLLEKVLSVGDLLMFLGLAALVLTLVSPPARAPGQEEPAYEQR